MIDRLRTPVLDSSGSEQGAGIAQLVEYELPKLGVAGSTPVARSKMTPGFSRA